MTTLDSLKKAATAAKNKKPRQLFEALSSAWTATPAAELSALAERASAAFPVEGLKDGDEWLEAAAGQKFELRPMLAATLRGGSVADAEARVSAAARWGADPFLANALVALLRNPPWTSSSSRRLWTKIFALVTAQKDPRFVELSRELPTTWGIRDDQKQWLTRALANAVEDFPSATPELPAAALELVKTLEAALVAPTAKKPKSSASEAELLAAIYENPADDAPRLVFADLLSEQGDPRGEFIALQLAKELTPAQRKQEAALLKKHGKAWLGRLAPLLAVDFEFRRGFVASGTVKFKHVQHAQEHAGHPEWATLEIARWSGAGSDTQIAGTRHISPAFRHLRRAEGVWLEGLLEAGQTTWALEHVNGTTDDEKVFAALFGNPRLAKLSSVGISSAQLRASWLQRVGGLRTLHVETPPKEPLLSFLAAAEKTQLEELGWGPLLFTRGKSGAFSRLTARARTFDWSYPSISLRSLAAHLEPLPDGLFEELALEFEDREWITLKKALEPTFERLRAKGGQLTSAGDAAKKELGLEQVEALAAGLERAVVAGRSAVRFVSVATGEVTGGFEFEAGGSLALSPDAKTLVVRRERSAARIDVATGKQTHEVAVVAGRAYSVAVSADGQRAAYGVGEELMLVDFAAGEAVKRGPGWSPAFERGGQRVALCRKNAVAVIDGTEVLEVPLPELEPRVVCLVSPSTLAVACHFRGVLLIDLQKREQIAKLEFDQLGQNPTSIELSPKGGVLLLQSGSTGVLVSADSLRVLEKLETQVRNARMVFLPDGRVAVAGPHRLTITSPGPRDTPR